MQPSKIILHKQEAQLELHFAGQSYLLAAEFLRVHSPSAEVQGHGPGQKNLPLDKAKVTITNIESQGNYALRLVFSDGHDSGLYTWAYLHDLCSNQEQYWQNYLCEAKLETERKQDSELNAVKWIHPKA